MQCVTIRVALNAPVSEEAEEEALHALLPPTVLHELSQSISTVPSVVVRAEYDVQLKCTPTTAFAQIAEWCFAFLNTTISLVNVFLRHKLGISLNFEPDRAFCE